MIAAVDDTEHSGQFGGRAAGEDMPREREMDRRGASERHSDVSGDHDASSDNTPVLTRIPPELVEQILHDLSSRDLCACLRVNSAFCSLSLPLLYAHVKLREFGPWPSFKDESSSPRSSPSASSGDDTRPAFLSRSALARHVRRLDIVPHETTVCEASGGGLLHWWHALPPLPRLRVVRLYLMATWSGNRVFHTNVDAHNPRRQPERNCAALWHLRAETLVVRGLTLAHSTVPRHELPQRFEDGVRHYVAVFQPDHPYFLARNAERTAQQQGVIFRSRIPHLVSRITVIFFPPGRSYAWRAGPGNHTLSWELIWTHAASLFANLAAWVTQRNPVPWALTVVNAEALQRIDDGSPSNDSGTMQQSVEEIFRAAVEERFADEAQRDRALECIRVIGMEQWLRGDEWRDIFDEDEVAPWRGMASARNTDNAFLGLKHIPQIPAAAPIHHLPLFQLAVSSE